MRLLWMLLILAKALAQLEEDQLREIRQTLAFFRGVQTTSYEVTLRIPVKTEGGNPRYTTKGNVSMTFRWVSNGIFDEPQRLVAVHARLISIDQKSVRLWHVHQWTSILKRIPVENMTIIHDDEIITFRLGAPDQLKSGNIYRLDIGEFTGRVEEDGAKNAIFLTSPGLATQFQLNDARRAFPCLDLPNKKAIFKFTIIHPSGYIALFNTDVDVGDTNGKTDQDGWTTSSFLPTPVMSTYIIGFTLIPK